MKKVSTWVEGDDGKRIISVYVEDRTAEILSQTDEAIRHEYILAEYNARKTDRKETRRHQSLEGIMASGREFAADNPDMTELSIAAEQKERVRAAIKKLRPTQQEIILLRFYYNKTQADIAREKGVSKAAVGQQLQRALKQLKKFFLKF